MAPSHVDPPPAPVAREPPAEEPGRCNFLLVAKNRRCRFTVPGGGRCGQHRENDDSRVPCPIDPSHTVFSSGLARHLKICTKLRDDRTLSSQPFYKCGVNLQADSNGEAVAVAEAAALGSSANLSSEELADWRTRIEAAYSQAALEVLGPECDHEAFLESSIVSEPGEIAHSEKHDVQNAALTELILGRGELTDDAVAIEYGCGRAGFSASLLASRPGTRCVLVDRDTRRHKLENRKECRAEQVLRLRLDIADFDLEAFMRERLDPAKLPVASDFQGSGLSVSKDGQGPAERLAEQWQTAARLQQEGAWPPKQIVATAKHLCGGGAFTGANLRLAWAGKKFPEVGGRL